MNIGIIIFVSFILLKIKIYSGLFALLQKFPQDIVPIVSISVITSILLKLHQLSTIPE